MMSSHGQGHVINYSTETSWGLWGPPACAGGEAVGVRYCILNSSLKEMFLSLIADNNVQKTAFLPLSVLNKQPPCVKTAAPVSRGVGMAESVMTLFLLDAIPGSVHPRLRSAFISHLQASSTQRRAEAKPKHTECISVSELPASVPRLLVVSPPS